MRLANYTRDVATGAALTTGSTAITGPDGGAVATVALDGATGRWSYEGNGSPGITQSSYTGAGQTRKIKGDAFGQEGWVYPAEIPEMMRIHGDGVYGSNPMPLTAPGGMTVQVGIGNMFILGVLLPIYTAQSLAVAAAHATLGRKDIIVGRLTRTGTFAGRTTLAVVTGTAAATPAAPATTQTADTWEVKLGEITVAAAASAITNGNLSTTGRELAGSSGGGGGGTGDVTGPASSVNGRMAVFSGTTGKIIQESSLTGLTKMTSGVVTSATIGTDYYGPGGTDVTVADGGTGASDKTTAFDNLAPTTTLGDMIYHNGTDNVRLVKSTAGYVLTQGVSFPYWAAPAAASSAIHVKEGGVTEHTAATILDFDTSDFNVVMVGTEADISLAYGTSAGTPAEGNHTHSYATTTSSTSIGDNQSNSATATCSSGTVTGGGCSWSSGELNNNLRSAAFSGNGFRCYGSNFSGGTVNLTAHARCVS